MSCYERNVYAWKERVSMLWDISMDIVCLTFSSFSLLRVCQVWMAKMNFLWANST